MRKLLVLVFLVLSGCYGPHLDLREPICFVVHPPESYTQYLALQNALINGPNDWLKHLPSLPPPYIVKSEDFCKNPPIHVYVKTMKDGICGFATPYIDHHRIILSNRYGRDGTDCITPHILAHELGHVLWNYEPPHITDGSLSLMSPDGNFYASPSDLDITCEKHSEITCHKMEWCVLDFYDSLRCPSATPEDGEAILKAKEKASSSEYSMPAICSME